MLQCLKRVVYQVSDLEKAKRWYREILDAEPTVDAPFAVFFQIGGYGLILMPKANPELKSDDIVVAYWGVDDVEHAYKKLLELGAAPHTGVRTGFGGIKSANVIDPFGNILGITSVSTEAKKRTVENQPSETALGVATVRAYAAVDEREEIRGSDYLAQIFITEDRKRALKDPAIRQWMIKNYLPPGTYEYFIARTAYFDQIMIQALEQNIPQVVFLGAGYDSRPYRFKDMIRDTRIFELDIRNTQQRKKELLKQVNIPIPEHLIYVPINFNTDNLKEVLFEAGFDKNKKTLFIWEGVTFYLPAGVIDDTLSFIKYNSPAGSSVCFDYDALSSELSDAYGVKELEGFMKSQMPSEPLQFGIEDGRIESFLSERGYKIISHLTAGDMERKYLILRDGSAAGKVPASHCFVHASVSD